MLSRLRMEPQIVGQGDVAQVAMEPGQYDHLQVGKPGLVLL